MAALICDHCAVDQRDFSGFARHVVLTREFAVFESLARALEQHGAAAARLGLWDEAAMARALHGRAVSFSERGQSAIEILANAAASLPTSDLRERIEVMIQRFLDR